MTCTPVAGLVAVIVCALAACSSSQPGAKPAKSTPPPSSPALTSSSPAPTPTKTPPQTPTHTKPKPKPLSPYEADPAVKALRAWAAQVGHTINKGKYDDAALNALMTPSLATTMKHLAGGDVGYRYPGPLPFTPTRVTVTSSTEHDVRICDVSDGYALNPRTGKPFAAYHVQAVDAGAVLRGGRWLVSKFDTGSFSCAGVTIPEPSW